MPLCYEITNWGCDELRLWQALPLGLKGFCCYLLHLKIGVRHRSIFRKAVGTSIVCALSEVIVVTSLVAYPTSEALQPVTEIGRF